MISHYKFSWLIKQLLLDPLHLYYRGYKPASSTKIKDFDDNVFGNYFFDDQIASVDFNGNVIWSHEEPLNSNDLNDLLYVMLNLDIPSVECRDIREYDTFPMCQMHGDVNFNAFANSEKSKLKQQWFQKFSKYSRMYDWYFFFHGFLALDWFRDYQYFPNPFRVEPDKVFICLNHLVENKRNYRITLLSYLEQQNLFEYGYISCPLLTQDIIKKELIDPFSQISQQSKLHIAKNLSNSNLPIMLDDIDFRTASASIPKQMHMSIWTVVTETVFYDEKLHLTEKIFKPIAIKRPFILVGSAGNLGYLKSYGFKTFSDFIDESYDDEPDPDIRIQKITKELQRLCNLSWEENLDMFRKMQTILDFNHEHFFNNFRKIITEELVDNFEKCVQLYNFDLSERFKLPIKNINFDHVKQLLLKT